MWAKPSRSDARERLPLRPEVERSRVLCRVRHGPRHPPRDADRAQASQRAPDLHPTAHALPRVHVHPRLGPRAHAWLPRPARRAPFGRATRWASASRPTVRRARFTTTGSRSAAATERSSPRWGGYRPALGLRQPLVPTAVLVSVLLGAHAGRERRDLEGLSRSLQRPRGAPASGVHRRGIAARRRPARIPSSTRNSAASLSGSDTLDCLRGVNVPAVAGKPVGAARPDPDLFRAAELDPCPVLRLVRSHAGSRHERAVRTRRMQEADEARSSGVVCRGRAPHGRCAADVLLRLFRQPARPARSPRAR